MPDHSSEQKPVQKTPFSGPSPAPASSSFGNWWSSLWGPPTNVYGLKGKDESKGWGKGQAPSIDKWQVWGIGRGNRDADKPNSQGKIEGQESTTNDQQVEHGVSDLNVPQADLSDIDTKTTGQRAEDTGWGSYHDSTSGTVVKGALKDQRPTFKYAPVTGKKILDLYGARAAAGVREKVGVRGMSRADGKYGSATVKGDAYAVAEAGADANAKLNSKDGAQVSANAGVKAGVGASGDADLKTKGWNIAGVDTPVDAGVGAHGEVFVGAKAGAGGRIGIGPKFIGAEGSIGGFAGVEAKGDVHANLGPLRGKLGGSLMAGAGIGANGGITYENGKIRIGGKAYAALGYGASVSGEITIDVKQAAQMAMAAGKAAYKLADGDGDGKLTLNDPATHVANAAKGGAALLDKGAVGLMHMLDADGNGKFSSDDLRLRMNQAGEALGAAKDRVLDGGKALLDKGRQALDRDGDGKLSLGDVKAGVGQLKDSAIKGIHNVEDMVGKGAKRVHDAVDHDGDGKIELSDIRAHLGDAGEAMLNKGKQVVDGVSKAGAQAKDWVVDKAGQAGKAVHDGLDADHDGKLSLNDAKVFGQRAYKGLTDAGKDVKEHAAHVLHDVHDAMDINHDGKVDSADAVAAGKNVAQVAKAAKQKAVETFNRTVAAGVENFEAAKQKAVAIGQAAHKAADRDGDGKLGWNDVRTGAAEVKDAVVGRVSDAYSAAKEQVSHAASTVREGFSSAASSVKGTWNKVSNFFGF